MLLCHTDLDFNNGANKFNKKLPKKEKMFNFEINRTHVLFALKLFYVNPSMYDEIRKDKPDIIHTIGLRSFQSIIAWYLSKKVNIPLVVSDQGGLTTHPFFDKSGFIIRVLYRIQNIFIKKIIRDASAISAANEYEKNIFRELNKTTKIQIIRNGVNLKTLVSKNKFKEKYKINYDFMLFVGRFSKSKGIKDLVHAMNIVKNERERTDLHLIIMGVDFGYEKDMEYMIKKFGLEDNIHVIKNPPREDVISAYDDSEFLILPSEWELSPLVPLESFAFKKPVISTRSHGIPFTVKHNENGILVEPQNSTELADAIIRLTDNSELRMRLGLEGYNFVHEECNCVSMARNSLDLYEDILGNNQNK